MNHRSKCKTRAFLEENTEKNLYEILSNKQFFDMIPKSMIYKKKSGKLNFIKI